METIQVRGARVHNLKNVDLSIPKQAVTVITGLSGSGKSSLAFDTILAEARRRFFFTLSHYTRQYLENFEKPDFDRIEGLSPAISLAQNETMPSRRASVASLTELGELTGVLFARFAQARCPEHDLPTEAQSVSDIRMQLEKRFMGKKVALCVPLVDERKGHFQELLERMVDQGYLHAYIDGALTYLDPLPKLAKSRKHTIKVIVDSMRIETAKRSRCEQSLQTALAMEGGRVEVLPAPVDGVWDLGKGLMFSQHAGCPECGFSWPEFDSRHFAANSLGRCLSCDGLGEVQTEREEAGAEQEDEAESFETCPDCHGTGLSAELRSVRLDGRDCLSLYQLSLAELAEWVEGLEQQTEPTTPMGRVLKEMAQRLRLICETGLGYLSLHRRVLSLSPGELQRLKLASLISEGLNGVLYVLDEPSQGLHPAELERVWQTLLTLKEAGNTILIVDHDEYFMERADLIVDLGPGGGDQGGEVVATFAPTLKELKKAQQASATARALLSLKTDRERSALKRPSSRDNTSTPKPNPRSAAVEPETVQSETAEPGATEPETESEKAQAWTLFEPRMHNLEIASVQIQPQAFNVVTGVSGAGKSSLILKCLYPLLKRQQRPSGRAAKSSSPGRKTSPTRTLVSRASRDELGRLEGGVAVDSVQLVDRRPLAKSSVSMPATYLGVFSAMRTLMAKTPAAQIAGLSARSFSLATSGGRCEACKGRGEVQLSMRFLPDAYMTCQECEGRRYLPDVLSVTYRGLSMDQILDLSIADAAEHFNHHKTISKALRPAVELGLGYLKLGQPTRTLSGGEAQRLKLSTYFTRQSVEGYVLIMDEPTTGMHLSDVERLLKQCARLVERGATVIAIEHSAQCMQAADWLIDIGPGSAEQGGQLMYQGPLLGFSSVQASSMTARYLFGESP